jgi:ech hydrogenase subunit F
MIKNIFKNLVTGSATRAYPIEVRPGFDNARGELSNDIDGCTLCGICAKKCPSQCILVDRKSGIWEMNPYSCVFCGICVDACPKSCLVHSSGHKKPVRAKASVVLNKEIKPKLKVVAEPA